MARDNTGCRVETSRGGQSVQAAELRMWRGRQSVPAAEWRRAQDANQQQGSLYSQDSESSSFHSAKSLELGKEASVPPPAGYCYFFLESSFIPEAQYLRVTGPGSREKGRFFVLERVETLRTEQGRSRKEKGPIVTTARQETCPNRKSSQPRDTLKTRFKCINVRFLALTNSTVWGCYFCQNGGEFSESEDPLGPKIYVIHKFFL